MLGRLVTKLKRQSLRDPSPLPRAAPSRRSARICALHSENNPTLHDSGTESDDDELEQLDCMSVGAQSSDVMGRSPPNLTSSPPLASDFDTNSWDSTGCESGIVLRDRSEEPSECSSDKPLHSTPSRSHNVLVSLTDKPETQTAGGRADANVDTGAFTRVARGDKGTIGEKRRYETTGGDCDCGHSPIASRLRSYTNVSWSGTERETLVAARKQPVRLIYHNPGGMRRASQPLATPVKTVGVVQCESPPNHPLKRGRLNTGTRPCLDFDKMRERMVLSAACGLGSQECLDEQEMDKRRQEWSMDSPLRCPHLLRCQQSTCSFPSAHL